MRRVGWLLLCVLAVGCQVGTEADDPDLMYSSPVALRPAAADVPPVPATRRWSGIYPVGSQVKDEEAFGGFGPCHNYPKELGNKQWGTKDAVSVVAFPDEPVAYFSCRGIPVRVINRTDKVVAFQACDSCLQLLQEARDGQGRWREIETPREAICGNSYHRVFLKPGQYWEVPARAYGGPVRTKVRFRLDPERLENGGEPIYSNEFDGRIANLQLRVGPDRRALARALHTRDMKPEERVAVLIEALGDDDPNTREEAAMSLGYAGAPAKPAIPALTAALKDSDSNTRAYAANALWKIAGQVEEPVRALTAVLGDRSDPHGQWRAAECLSEMGPAAASAVPALCEALQDTEERVRGQVALALGNIHARPDLSVPALTEALQDPEWLVRSYAAAALGRFGKEARHAVPALTQVFRLDKEHLVRLSAARALWEIEADAERLVPYLIETLTSHEDYGPESAAELLGRIGPKAREAVPHLTKALDRDRRSLNIDAALALWKVTEQAEPAVAVLTRELLKDACLADGAHAVGSEDSMESNTGRALDYLGEIGPAARSAVPTLLRAHARVRGMFRNEVAAALRRIDPEAAAKAGIPSAPAKDERR